MSLALYIQSLILKGGITRQQHERALSVTGFIYSELDLKGGITRQRHERASVTGFVYSELDFKGGITRQRHERALSVTGALMSASAGCRRVPSFTSILSTYPIASSTYLLAHVSSLYPIATCSTNLRQNPLQICIPRSYYCLHQQPL